MLFAKYYVDTQTVWLPEYRHDDSEFSLFYNNIVVFKLLC